MADRFPLIVNETSRKIEEMGSGDNLDLTGNGIAINGDTGTGKYLKSEGGVVSWANPGDVYLTLTQTVSNKTFETCTISGNINSITNIPNSALVNSGITLNGATIPLGGSASTPNDDTTYTISAVDAISASEKIIRLTAGGSGSGNDDITIGVTSPSSVNPGYKPLSLEISRTNDKILIFGSVEDSNTITTLTAPGGSPTSGAITFAAANAASVSMSGSTITFSATDTDTKTKIRVGTSASYLPSDNTLSNFTFLSSGGLTINQGSNESTGDPEITFNSSDTVTRVRGGASSSFLPASTGTSNTDITIIGGTHRDSSVSVIQNGNNIEIDAFNDDTITKIGSVASNGTFALAAGDYRFTASNAAQLTQTTDSETGVTTIDISAINTDTGAGLSASSGIILSDSDFQLSNSSAFTDQTLLKWDSANSQLVNSAIVDNGTDVTINGNLNVTGSTTTLDSTVLRVADPIIELRKGTSLTGANGGIQVNRTTDSNDLVQTWIQLQWFETGGYWRSIDNGGVARRFVTETETQTLSNKTLASPSFTGTTNVGVITATSINGLAVSTTIGATLDFADQKTLTISNTLQLSGTDGSTINFGNGGGAGSTVAYTSNNLGAFAQTTSTQLRGTLSDPTGSGSVVFSTSPSFSTGINTASTSFSIFNATATTINAFGAATDINIGAATGTTTIAHNFEVNGNVTLNSDDNDSFTVNGGVVNFENSDITIRGTDTNPMTLGRGNSAVASNTALGVEVLSVNQGGSQNVGVGYQALANNVSGFGNVAIGDGAMRNSDVGDNNVSIGKDCNLNLEGGDNNVSVGNSAMYGNVNGNDNVCLGAFAGYNMTGNGNVLIGSGRPINQVNGPTYSPGSISGDNQLVIGTSSSNGQGAWIRGDNSFNVYLDNNLNVGGTLEVTGNLVVNGTTTSLNVQTIQIDDNALELAAVTTATFAGNIISGSPSVTNIDSLTGIIPGMTVNVISGASLPTGTTTVVSVDIVGSSVTLSNPVSGASGTAVFEAVGPTDVAANGGGLILKGGTTNKTILYDNTRTDKYWVLSENLELKANRHLAINGIQVLNSTTLGSTVVNSSLTSVGTLTGLTVNGAAAFGGRIKESNDNNFNTALVPVSNVLTINTATSNTICGTPSAAAINTWAFTNTNLGNGESLTITLILQSNTSALYGDACTVDGTSISNGVKWSGGSPPLPTNNVDILTFIIVKDGAGTVQVFGQGNTDFS